MAVKEKALRRLADKLNAAGVPWGIGASWLLCQKGILDTYHDFDIFVAPEDAPRADKVLSRLGMRSEAETADDGAFRAAYHFDGADIELNAWTQINDTWHVRFGADCVAEDASVLGAAVHLMHLEDWLVLYGLMDRMNRAEAIAVYLKNNGCAHPERFAQVTTDALPEAVAALISTVVEG